jgi:dTMP kinase
MLTDLSYSLNRARRRNAADSKHSIDDENRFEKENRQFHQRVLDAYLSVAQREPQRVVKVEAKDPIGSVHKKITAVLEQRFGLATKWSR